MIESLASLPKLKATIRLSKEICVMCGAQHIELFCYSHPNFRGKHGTLYALPRLPERPVRNKHMPKCVFYVVMAASSRIGHCVWPPSFGVFSNESKTLMNVHLCSASHCKHRILDTRYTIDGETSANWLAFAIETTYDELMAHTIHETLSECPHFLAVFRRKTMAKLFQHSASAPLRSGCQRRQQ